MKNQDRNFKLQTALILLLIVIIVIILFLLNLQFFSQKEEIQLPNSRFEPVLQNPSNSEPNPYLNDIKLDENVAKFNTILQYEDDQINRILMQKSNQQKLKKEEEKRAFKNQILEEQKKSQIKKNENLISNETILRVKTTEDPNFVEYKSGGFYISKTLKIDEIKTSSKSEFSKIQKVQTKENENGFVSKDIKKDLATNSKPKLAIIIDDVGTFKHAKDIKETKLNITPSIFPPTKTLPDTPKIAKMFDFYMIHFPLEALNFNGAEENTLTTLDSYEKIDKRVEFIRQNFPNAKFTNNHTGSKFTADEKAMRNLFKALDKYGFKFIDSKTTNLSVTPNIYQYYTQKFIYRDVFLDNIDSEAEVIKQLKLAVETAKKKGFAIAIGHPKKSTMSVLQNTNGILKDVELVNIKDLYEYY